MRVIFFLPSHEHVAEIVKLLRKHYGSLDDSITIQASLMKLGM